MKEIGKRSKGDMKEHTLLESEQLEVEMHCCRGGCFNYSIKKGDGKVYEQISKPMQREHDNSISWIALTLSHCGLDGLNTPHPCCNYDINLDQLEISKEIDFWKQKVWNVWKCVYS